MKEQDCLLLVTLHEEQNMTNAADRLYLSQPAISYRLRQIEKEYTIKIINREGNKIRFTPEGEYLVEFSKNTLLELSKMKDYIKTIKNDTQGRLRIGVSSNFALYKLPPLVRKFLELHPKVQVKVNTGWSSEIVQLLEKNEIQIGIITGNYKWLEKKVLLNQDPISIISKKPINLKELPFLPMISYQPNNLIRKTQKPANPLSELIENWWQEKFKSPPMTSMEVDKVETCKEMVQNNLGYSIIPKSCLTNNDSFYSYDLKMENNQLIYRKTWLIFRESSLQLTTVNDFAEHMKRAMRS
ncbi:LysR family transcriptional regulator [Virgibacillus necropolis]|uniref:LysR family transcriptional regulator n=1 Tax=Virgibacillus necropolis TaxID=163877 RepID=A0A221M9T0_9BACI|nr:LysR family transcriptional regulator [Virgibacillus necropolis]ASN04397.1 LysR family transcriptional regulator [Virgibacillus necropolis]